MDLHAIIGRKQVELEAMHDEYNHLLAVLAEVAAGTIAPSQVTVDRTARTWALSPAPTVTLSLVPPTEP